MSCDVHMFYLPADFKLDIKTRIACIKLAKCLDLSIIRFMVI